MDPKKNLTNGQTIAVTLGLCAVAGFFINIFAPKQPTQQATAPIPEEKPASLIPKSTTTAIADFKQSLPAEDTRLRDYIRADAFLGEFLGNVWIGYADRADLISRGFFINPLYKHVGEGEGDPATAKGACSPIGFNGGAYICGKGRMAPHQWGIQSDDAISRLNQLEEGWSASPQSMTTPPKLEATAPAASPTKVEAANQITLDRDAPSGQAAELNGPDPDAKIKVYDAAIKPLHYGFPGDRVTVLGNGTSPNGDMWHQIRFDQSGAEGWVSRRNINFVGMTREAPSEPQPQTNSAPSQPSSGRCNSPDDIDSRGRRCGARAKQR